MGEIFSKYDCNKCKMNINIDKTCPDDVDYCDCTVCNNPIKHCCKCKMNYNDVLTEILYYLKLGIKYFETKQNFDSYKSY